MSSRTYWLHVDRALEIAHVVSLQLPLSEPVEDGKAVGYAYRDIGNVIDFTAHVADTTHGDADAILMAAEMKGDLDLWLDITQEQFCSAVAAGDIIGSRRTSITGYHFLNGLAILNTIDKCAPAVPATLGREE